MKASRDLQDKLTAETRSRGEETSEPLTTEARRHGEDGDKGELVGLDCFRTTRQVSAFTDHPITCDHQIIRSTSARALITKTIRTLRATFREIFDESAYDRFLLRTHASRSVASYRAFTRERDAAVLKKPRCC
jgi:hypothetical protein